MSDDDSILLSSGQRIYAHCQIRRLEEKLRVRTRLLFTALVSAWVFLIAAFLGR